MTLRATGLTGENVCVEKEKSKYVVRLTKETLLGRPASPFDLGEGVVMGEAIADAVRNIERFVASLDAARKEILEYLEMNRMGKV